MMTIIKRAAMILLALVMVLGTAGAETLSLNGTVEAGTVVPVYAPIGGTVENVALEQGMRVNAEDTLFTYRTEKTYAAADGTVTRIWDDVAKVPYLADPLGVNVLSYDDPESVKYKGEYVNSKKILGAMFWEYRYDTDDHALLKSLVKSIYGKDSVL